MSEAPERDDVTGIETTGHEWDGITELDQPLPKWWLTIFYASIIGSVLFWIAYPSWPVWLGEWTYTKGVMGDTTRDDVAQELAAVAEARADTLTRIRESELSAIGGDPELLRFALASGEAAFGDNCAPCHGSGAQGFTGYPNLNDDAWLWGGTLEDIHTTLLHGIRWDADPMTRNNIMQAYLDDGMLTRDQVSDVTQYVLDLSGRAQDTEAAARGSETFQQICSACHGMEGKGNEMLGAPDLTDAIWLYGGDAEAIYNSVAHGRNGVMPAWSDRLDPATIKSLTLYVHSLGGGQ